MTRRRAYLLVVCACALPRLAVLLYERSAIVTSLTEKSWYIAQVFVKSGTFGYAPGISTAYTQPLYGVFLVPIVWLFGTSWLAVGLIQVAVAVGTALLVYEIGRRVTGTPWAALLAALISTLEPYLVWHDVHLNREILDQFLGASMVLLALIAAERRTWRPALALGAVSGVALLSNSRLVALPLVLAAYLLWRRVPLLAVVGLLVVCGVVVSPWIVRNKVEVGCFALTTDGRSLWKANNPETYATLASGLSIDDVPPITTDTPENNWYLWNEHRPLQHYDECAQMTQYESKVLAFWQHHPGAKAKLMVQATEFLWQPAVRNDEGSSAATGIVEFMREVVEPAYIIPLYLLALAGLFVVPRSFRVLALSFVVYETAEAWVFAGTTRYRIAWDFVLALLAAAALSRVPWSRLSPSRRSSQ